MATIRRVRLRVPAKINLDLKVLNRGEDGFHELRSVFQTVSLADELDMEYAPGRKLEISVDDEAGIADNLVVRAARKVAGAAGGAGRVSMRLRKRIPMGAGMGGGSADAAAVLLALPVLAGWTIPLPVLAGIGAEIGSDVPFFLYGGTAVAVGRGTELYPVRDVPFGRLVIVAPQVGVSTPEAYRAFDRAGAGKLTESQRIQYIDSFQSRVWRLGESASWAGLGNQLENDFERVVFPKHPPLKSILKKLNEAGAAAARMTGSGSALFGVFTTQSQAREARKACETLRPAPRVMEATFLSRARYRALWRRQLQEHMDGTQDGTAWPPTSRYSRKRRFDA